MTTQQQDDAKLIQALGYFNKVMFRDEDHSYYLGHWDDEGSKSLTSVTTIIGAYAPFDAEGAAKSKAEKIGTTAEALLIEWEENRSQAAARGTAFHTYAEDYISHKVFPRDDVSPEMALLFRNYQAQVRDTLIPLRSEWVVYDLDYMVAGQVDQLYWSKKWNCYILADWKTSKRWRDWAPWKMEGILSNLPICETSKFSLQLCMYEYLIKKNTGLDMGAGIVVWFNEKKNEYVIKRRENYMGYIEPLLEAHKKSLLKEKGD